MPKLGQYFLVDKSVLAKIIKTADLKKSDIVLEIGPGKGVLTREIAERVKKVIAVELDKDLAQSLKIPKTQVINTDILKLKIKNLIEIRNFKPLLNYNKYEANKKLPPIKLPNRTNLLY